VNSTAALDFLRRRVYRAGADERVQQFGAAVPLKLTVLYSAVRSRCAAPSFVYRRPGMV
jgi:hypothetical protein